jgi:hypothetical protein
MPDQEFELDVFRDLLEEAKIIGQLAEDEGAFREAYEAFRAGDVRKFQDVLKRVPSLRWRDKMPSIRRILTTVQLTITQRSKPKIRLKRVGT